MTAKLYNYISSSILSLSSLHNENKILKELIKSKDKEINEKNLLILNLETLKSNNKQLEIMNKLYMQKLKEYKIDLSQIIDDNKKIIFNLKKNNDELFIFNLDEIDKKDKEIEKIKENYDKKDKELMAFQLILFTPFYISNADFYIVLNHIKIIYNSFFIFIVLFFGTYFSGRS